MAVRQYIGARYVPLYAGDWDSTKNYEPLTIVTDANGNSFTSIKDVPAGTALTDRNYWIQTSSFSGAIDVLQRRMSDAEADIDVLEEWKTETEEPKKALFIGDSYSQSLGFYPNLADMLGYDSNNRTIWALGGYGFIGNVTGGGAWIDYFNANVGNITDKEKYDLIVITGGLNDYRPENTVDSIKNAIKIFVEACKAQFPNAVVKIGMIDTNFNMTNAAQLQRYREVYGKVLPAYNQCCEYGAEYLTGSEWILYNRARLRGDNLDHPLVTEENRIWVASHLAQAIRNGSVTVIERCDITFSNTDITDVPITGYGGILERINDHFVIIDSVNYAGVFEIFEKTSRERSQYSGISLDPAVKSNVLPILPPLVLSSSVHTDCYVSNCSAYADTTSTSKGVGQINVKAGCHNNDGTITLQMTAFINANMAGTYKGGIRVIMPIVWNFWHHT